LGLEVLSYAWKWIKRNRKTGIGNGKNLFSVIELLADGQVAICRRCSVDMGWLKNGIPKKDDLFLKKKT
jgi:hypothetical protein